jgi:hypothetical protein
VLPSPGTKCNDITDVMFGNKTAPTTMTKRALDDHHDLEKRMFEVEVAKVLSKIKFRHAFVV